MSLRRWIFFFGFFGDDQLFISLLCLLLLFISNIYSPIVYPVHTTPQEAHGGTVEGLNADGAAAVAGDDGWSRLRHSDDLFGNKGPLWNRFWSMHEPQREVGALTFALVFISLEQNLGAEVEVHANRVIARSAKSSFCLRFASRRVSSALSLQHERDVFVNQVDASSNASGGALKPTDISNTAQLIAAHKRSRTSVNTTLTAGVRGARRGAGDGGSQPHGDWAHRAGRGYGDPVRRRPAPHRRGDLVEVRGPRRGVELRRRRRQGPLRGQDGDSAECLRSRRRLKPSRDYLQ